MYLYLSTQHNFLGLQSTPHKACRFHFPHWPRDSIQECKRWLLSNYSWQCCCHISHSLYTLLQKDLRRDLQACCTSSSDWSCTLLSKVRVCQNTLDTPSAVDFRAKTSRCRTLFRIHHRHVPQSTPNNSLDWWSNLGTPGPSQRNWPGSWTFKIQSMIPRKIDQKRSDLLSSYKADRRCNV